MTVAPFFCAKLLKAIYHEEHEGHEDVNVKSIKRIHHEEREALEGF